MKFPFREFWSRLIVEFGEYTYESSVQCNLEGRRLRVESKYYFSRSGTSTRSSFQKMSLKSFHHA
jgi:hypothetical protein